MKNKILEFLLIVVAVVALSSCGTIAVPCDDIATLSEEGALYLCNVLTNRLPPASTLSATEKVQAAASISALQSIIAGYRTAALAQANVYTFQGNTARAAAIVQAADALAGKSDTLAVMVKEYTGK
jgi:hypothetical protein